MEFVIDDPGLGSVARLEGGLAKRLPHIHYRQTNSAAFLGSKPSEEGIKACFRAVFSAEPDRPSGKQIADDDSIFVSFADSDFVNADDCGFGGTGDAQLLGHVKLVEVFDCLPIKAKFFGHSVDIRFSAAVSDEKAKATGVAWEVGKPVKFFGFHATPKTMHTINRDFKENLLVAAGEVPNEPRADIVMGV